MQSELREIRIRPKAPEGCLNCGAQGHSFKFCKKQYNGRFCQICANPEFSTDKCPWPHAAKGKFDVPEYQRCKGCRRPKNLPDINCGDCRNRVIETKIAQRDKQMLEMIKQTFTTTSTSQATGTIPKVRKQETLEVTLPQADLVPQKSLQEPR